MAIQGPYSDGGYEIWCEECGGKITCFALNEIFCLKPSPKIRFIWYERFKCKDCREFSPMNDDENLSEREQLLFNELEKRNEIEQEFENRNKNKLRP